MATGTQQVKDLQTKLNASGAGLKVDGIYGPLTAAAATKYSTPVAPVNTNTNSNSNSNSNSSSSSSSNNNSNSSGDSFMKAIQEKLLGQSSVISSTNSQLESRLNAAISGVGKARDATDKSIESQYGREADFQSGQGSLAIQGQLEGRVGFATQMVAFRNLVDTTDKSLKDLEQRKNELILQNDATAASKIADLQFQALDFQQKAQQQTFSNLLGMANFGIANQQEKRLAEAQTFTEKKAMSDIALQYGLDVKDGDTIDTMTSKAMVFASEEQKVKLAKMQADIKYTNAQTAHILAGDKAAKTAVITPDVTDKLAARWNELAGKGYTVDTSAEMENILGKYAKTGKEADFYDAVSRNSVESAKAQMEAKKATEAAATGSSNLNGLPGGYLKMGKAVQHGSTNFVNWLLGSQVFEKI